MTQNYRLDNIGLINRDKKISFKFNGVTYFGYGGDTLASALLANGVHLIGRSFKYHRPRGFFGAGVDEPYAIVQLYRNNETEPNVKATEQELFEGLEATSVNCWPSVNFDIGASYNYLEFFAHLTVKNAVETRRNIYTAYESNNLRKFILSAGYTFGDAEVILWEPSIMFQSIEKTKESSIDFNLKAYKNFEDGKIWGGLSYRRSLDGTQYFIKSI